MTPRAVVIVHGEAMVAEGLAAALDRFPALLSLGVATNAVEGERIGERAHAVALYGKLPGAIDLARTLRRKGVRVVVIGVGGDEDGVMVPTDAPVARLADALAPGAGAVPQVAPRLSPREREVLSLIRRGIAGKQIGRLLGISPKTVENHKARIFSKLGVPNQTAAAAVAARMEAVN